MAAPASSISIAFLTSIPDDPDIAVRRDVIARSIEQAPEAGLLVLPYLGFHTSFWRVIDRQAAFRQAERPPFRSIELAESAAEARGIPVLGTVYEVLGEGVFYALATVTPGESKRRWRYRQQHALNRPGLHERLYFQPGSAVAVPMFELGGVNVGLLMGGDLWVPEAARLLRLSGADLIIALGAFPAWIENEVATLASARAIENGIPVLLANRSQAIAPYGEGVEVNAATQSGGWMLVQVDRDRIARSLRREDPLWMRRPRLYASLSATWQDEKG